ncbi:MAG: pilus assembly protein [Yoonia sp.]|uniref:TadE/TadG family type IV pilus assembly protein n=1 Tax=Yoonia sp. TaxID=2212373 RepID=UPI00273F4AF8|nr:TadE/TadG family type IV pilus assembly protein [Yoonia sp.]MDP5084358.1 pilus assembly protein [Yoonia sp.]
MNLKKITNLVSRFLRDDKGTASVEFVLVFPVFFGFFLMTYESGVLSARHVMLERGVDVTVREVRIGNIPNPTRDILRQRICDVSLMLQNCMELLEIELIQKDPLNWTPVSTDVRCIDRGQVVQPVVTVDQSANNRLMFLRACIRVEPFLPSSWLGAAIVANNASTEASGSIALVAMGAFVVEPFRTP